TLPEIARELNVDAVVEGSVLRSGDRVRITAQLIHAPTDRHLWAEAYERDLQNVLALQDEVARAIASEIQVKLTSQEQSHLSSAHAVNPEAYQLYLKGRHFWSRRSERDINRGAEYFQQATEKDPTYAPAYAGLADSYTVLRTFHFLSPHVASLRARQAAEKAVELDHTLAEAHTSLAAIEWDDLEWASAEKEFKQSLE